MQAGPRELRDWIARREFTQDEAARYLELDPSVLSKLAKGTRNAGLRIALVIERKTGIPVESWVSMDDDNWLTGVPVNRRNSRSDK